MVLAKRQTIRRTLALLSMGAILIGSCLAYLRRSADISHEKSLNYKLGFGTPQGWKAIPHSSQALFLYLDPKSRLLIRGAMTDIVSEVNPTPDLDRDATAQQMLDVTAQNLHGWKGELGDVVDGKDISFRIIRRSCDAKCVISAISVKGNTTVVVTLSADKEQLKSIDAAVPSFKTYLASLSFAPYVYTF